MTIFSSDLTWLILLPVIGALAVYATPAKTARWVALLFSALTFALALYIFFNMLPTGFGDVHHLPDDINIPSINFGVGTTRLKIDYFLGIDGLSLPMVVLNGLLTMLAIIGGWAKERVKDYMALLLLLEGGVMGVFLSLDLLLFFLFWEVELAPMFLLIGIWGNQQIKHGMPGRIYSAWKLLPCTSVGSVFLLIGILVPYLTNASPSHNGMPTASMSYFSTHMFTIPMTIPLINVTIGSQLLIFLLIYTAFAVKIPMFPFHTWLPDAHTDAPTEVSVILAGVLLKMGAYGLIRMCLGLYPRGVQEFAGVLSVLAVINILYGASICLVQKDMKKLIAYSSVSHMGIILLGVAAAASNGSLEFRSVALTGAALQMFCHGIITGLLFFCVGVIYDHAHTREISAFGGVAKKMPMLATLFTFAAMASLGLPGLAGFVAEYMVFTSSFGVIQSATTAAVFTMILTAAYLLWMIKRVFFDTFNHRWDRLLDASLREMIPLLVLAALILFVGLYPKPLIDVIVPSLPHPVQTAVLLIK